MKKLVLSVLILSCVMPGILIAQDSATLKAALPDGFSIISVNQEATPLSAEVRGPDGKVSTVYMIKGQDGQWVASSDPHYFRPPGDTFAQSEQKMDTEIKSNEQKMHRKYEEQQRDQDIADDVNDDRR